MQAAPSGDQAPEPDSTVAPVSAMAAAIGFVIAVQARPATGNWLDLALVALVLVLGALVAYAARGPLPLRVTGAIVAVIAAWLLPQRADAGSAVILAGFFGVGIGLIGVRLQRAELLRITITTMLAVALLVIVRRVASIHTVGAVVAVSAVFVVVAAATIEYRPDFGAIDRRGAPRIITWIVLVAVLAFAAYVGTETPTSHWFGGGITHGTADFNDVALTFDDGPNLSATLPIMRILDAAGVKGTFFEVGKAIDAEPQITRALYKDGQLLGNHSYHHDQWRWLDPRYPELERTQEAFRSAVGVCPAYYRPPHGDRTPFIARVVHDHHMRIVMWSDSSGDWDATSARTIARRVLRRAKAGSIIVLHDGLDGNPTANREVLVRALPLILAGLRAKHLDVVGLDKLIGGPAFIPCN